MRMRNYRNRIVNGRYYVMCYLSNLIVISLITFLHYVLQHIYMYPCICSLYICVSADLISKVHDDRVDVVVRCLMSMVFNWFCYLKRGESEKEQIYSIDFKIEWFDWRIKCGRIKRTLIILGNKSRIKQ